MIDPSDAFEVALQEGYHEESLHYARALHLAERITTDLKQGSRADEHFGQLHGLFARISAVEARLAALPRPSMRGCGEAATARAKEDVLALLEKLVAEIRRGEREAVARRDLLVLPIEIGIRVRRMQQAYGQGG